jgi:hypothetical protein
MDATTTANSLTAVISPMGRPARFNATERRALGLLIVSVAAFGIYGFATDSPSTLSYVVTVSVLGALLATFRRDALPPRLTFALALLVVAHLAGGLINVGDDVLYNAHVFSPALQYDHFVHASGVFLGTIVVWTLLIPSFPRASRPRDFITITMLAGLGLGAANETIEFLTTLAHHGDHVGGYSNTGWDLVSNVVGATAAGAWMRRAQHS